MSYLCNDIQQFIQQIKRLRTGKTHKLKRDTSSSLLIVYYYIGAFTAIMPDSTHHHFNSVWLQLHTIPSSLEQCKRVHSLERSKLLQQNGSD